MAKSEVYISFIIDNLRNGIVERHEILSMFVKKWQVSDRTFDRAWKKAKDDFIEYQNKLQNKKEDISIEAEKEAIKEGLKLKLERQLEIQNDIKAIDEKITSNQVEDFIFIKGEKVLHIRQLYPNELAILIKTKKELHAELSKMAGEYAPTKIDSVHVFNGYDDIIIK